MPTILPSIPSISPMLMGCLGVSHLFLLQGCVKTAVKWKSWDIASKRLEIIFELCLVVLPPSLPSQNVCVLSCRNQEMFGGAVKLPCSELCKAAGVKGGGLQTGLGEPVCVWEGKGRWWLSSLEQRAQNGPVSVTMGWGFGLRLLPSSRPTLVSSLGEDGRDSLVTQLPQNPLPGTPTIPEVALWQTFRWTLVCYPHYFNFAVRSRQPKNSVVVPLPKPFRMVFSSTWRESCDLDPHREAEAIGEAVTEQGGEL